MSKYCGPFAIAFLLKVTPDTAAQKIKEIDPSPRYSRGVRGMYHTSMEKVLQSVVGVKGCVTEPHCQMKTWAANRMRRGDNGTWVLLVTSHYVIYRRGVIYDTIAKDGLAFQFHVASKRRLRRAWYLGELT